MARGNDWLRIGLLAGATLVASAWPALSVWAQSQDAINATVSERVAYLGMRLDKIDSMINAVLIALVVNFIAQIVQIKRAPESRRH